MVLATSDSCDTLVSLGNGIKQLNGSDVSHVSQSVDQYYLTELHLPSDQFDDDDWNNNLNQLDQRVYFPKSEAVDQYLKNVPQIMEYCDELLANSPRRFDETSSERILYVAQGEVGHTLSSQCDVIVSDKATTCHILALRSESSTNSSLSSLTHIDSASYESCVRSMFLEHIAHHSYSSEKIEMKIHVVGGFDDQKESSREISNWLMRLIAQVAEEEEESMKMTLQTCAISSMNDTGFSCPIGRGLGLDTRTGEVFLASVDNSVAGPSVVLRSIRLWSQGEEQKLSLVHNQKSNNFCIKAFSFEGCKEFTQLLQLPDDWLLNYTSTSPDVEEPDFCNSVRASLKFLLDVPCTRVFGSNVNKHLTFQRSNCTNSWRRSS